MTRTFTVNQNLLGKMIRRLCFRIILIYGIILALGMISSFITRDTPSDAYNLFAILTTVLMLIALLVGYKTLRTMYQHFQLTIDSNGIEITAPDNAYKRIEWDEAAYIEENGGGLKVYNKYVNAASWRRSGDNVLLIPREINDRDQLIALLNRYTN